VSEQKIFKTMVGFDDGAIDRVDTIKHDKKLWLVPFWLDQPALKLTRPARLIRLDSLSHFDSSGPTWDFVLNGSMPRALFETRPLKQEVSGFEVVELPDIWLNS
jgi:hypothetical protein